MSCLSKWLYGLIMLKVATVLTFSLVLRVLNGEFIMVVDENY